MHNLNINLASFAVSEYNSRGRQYPVSLSKDRNAFQRDYTRILHSRSFRKLHGKTQVFPAEMGEMADTYRTRMSHSFEVEQLARSTSRALNVNQDFCGALAIGHDIGHAPFGHLGQDILNELFIDVGGFEHNHQALLIIDELESPYPEHKGLNLMFETREGLLKHCNKERAKLLGSVAERHLTGKSPPLEVQIVDSCDKIAYLHGDLEDAFDKGLFRDIDLMNDIPGFNEAWEMVLKEKPFLSFPKKDALVNEDVFVRSQCNAIIGEVWRKMLSNSIENLIVTSKSNLESNNIQTISEVRNSLPLIQFSKEFYELNKSIRSFSRENIYSHHRVLNYLGNAQKAFYALYEDASKNPQEFNLPSNLSKEDFKNWMSSLTDRSVLSWYSNKYNCDIIPIINIKKRFG